VTTPPPPYGAYPPPPYDGYYGYRSAYPLPRSTNSLAIVSLVCAFLFAPLGIVFGHMSLSQIKKTGEEGRGLAIAGLVIGYLITALTVLVVVLSVLFLVMVARDLERLDGLIPDRPGLTASPFPPSDHTLPPFAPPATLGSNCQYPATTEAASKPAKPPRNGRIPTDPALVSATLRTNRGAIGLQLENGRTPCTVNNFTSLAQQGFFDNTTCHRITTAPGLQVLQCGDPSGTGSGGPGYTIPDEVFPELKYGRGILAMANTGQPNSGGSQFFMIYGDGELPPQYTAFGSITPDGLQVRDTIAKRGSDGSLEPSPGGGKPVQPVTIEKATVA